VRSFYTYWEHEIFTALVELVIRNLCQFFENIFGTSSLFIVDVLLAPPRIKLQPPLEEIINSIRRSAHGISELPKHFIRWLHGSCISCPSTAVTDENFEPPDFTFNNDIKQQPDVISTLKPVRSYASGLVTAINRILTQLLTYNDLWKSDKQKYTSRFALKSRTYSDYDEMMRVFSKVDQTFDHYLINKNIYSIQLSFKQFYQALKYHSKEWIHHYGQHLYVKMSNKLKEINENLNHLSHGLHHDADTVPDLKFVLNIIAQINQQQESIGHDIHEIEQSYRILHQHHFDYPQSEWMLIQTLAPRLAELVNQSRIVQHRLKPIRERFREIIQYDIELFQRMVDELVEKFDKYGPYTIENDLNQSFLLVKQYEKDLQKIEQRKIELINVMKLFHIPLINYPDLIRLQKEINGLNILFDLYNDFKRNEKLWSKILWTELDINDLIINVDLFIKNFRQLSQDIKSTVVGQAVEKYLTGNFDIDKLCNDRRLRHTLKKGYITEP
jgi:dynein heavy chain